MGDTEVKQAVQGVARGIKRVAREALGVENEAKASNSGSTFALGYMGTRSIFRRPLYSRAVIEDKFDHLECGSFGTKISMVDWNATQVFEEFHIGQLMVASGSLGGRTVANRTPTQGTSRTERIGDAIYLDYLDLRLCLEAEAYEGTAIKPQCCRLVVLQLTDSSSEDGPRTFQVQHFFETGNITSGYCRNVLRQERAAAAGGDEKFVRTYRVLLDKTFTVGAGAPFEEKRMHLKYKLGAQMFQDNVASAINVMPGRIIWQMFTEEPTLLNRPSFYGDWRWQFRDP